MADRKSNSRLFRNLAEEVFQGLAAQGRIFQSEAGDFITSLVRQWLTYDGNATWFFGEEQLRFVHRHTPLGKLFLATERVQPGWFADLRGKWNIDPEEFCGIIEQLNRGQSPEVTNTEGVPLRLWVNPKEGNVGVEKLLARQPNLPETKRRDYRKIASQELAGNLGIAVEKQELEALSGSVVAQWQQFEGHACIFLDRGEQLVLTLTEQGDGCKVATVRRKGSIEPDLSFLGFPPDALADVIAHINLGQTVEFRGKEGVPTILRYNPKKMKIEVRPRDYAFPNARFKLGQVEIESRASMVLARSGQDAACFLRRHAAGDCGDLSDKEKFENEYRLKKGESINSCYHTSLGETILVSTSGDRQRTVLSAPDPEIGREMVRKAHDGTERL